MPNKSERGALLAPSSLPHLYPNNQKAPMSGHRVTRVFGDISSIANILKADPDCGSSDHHSSPAQNASCDQDLIILCQNFRIRLREWIEQVGKQGIESYDEKAEPGRALHALREEWGASLAALQSLAPRTVAGANDKLLAAQVFLTFCCGADGSAIELLALATRELDHVIGADRTSDRTQTPLRPRAQGAFWWLERLKRRM